MFCVTSTRQSGLSWSCRRAPGPGGTAREAAAAVPGSRLPPGTCWPGASAGPVGTCLQLEACRGCLGWLAAPSPVSPCSNAQPSLLLLLACSPSRCQLCPIGTCCAPQVHAALSQDCADVAVAGSRGLAVYSRRARRWRLFGDATQERSLRVRVAVRLCGRASSACSWPLGWTP
jgi:hypothetical protein